MSSSLLRYRSAPINMFGDICDDFLPVRPSSPDTETMFARFLSVPPTTTGVAKAPTPAPPHNRAYSASNMSYQQMLSRSPVDTPYRVPTEMELIKTEGELDGGGDFSNFQNLIRHSSSPAGLFSQLDAETGFTSIRGLKHQLSFSPGWEYPSPISGSKTPREVEIEAKLLAGLNMQSELQAQDSVLCKMRAKRGCATHPRSIAERVRRTRISERMRKLQELVPNMDKQTNTSDMLDLAVEHIKDLQAQVKRLSESRARCTCCSSKRIRGSTPGV